MEPIHGDLARSLDDHAIFRRFYDLAQVNLDYIDEDIEQLRELAVEIEEFADRIVAHVDSRGTQVELTVEKLDAAMKALDQLACKYRNFLIGECYSALASTVLFDWTKILRQPIFPAGEAC